MEEKFKKQFFKTKFFDVEDRLDGYKYLLVMYFNETDPLGVETADNICICDTRHECMQKIDELISNHELLDNVELAAPCNITDMETIVKWRMKDNNMTWFWTFSIYPVQYLTEKTSE